MLSIVGVYERNKLEVADPVIDAHNIKFVALMKKIGVSLRQKNRRISDMPFNVAVNVASCRMIKKTKDYPLRG